MPVNRNLYFLQRGLAAGSTCGRSCQLSPYSYSVCFSGYFNCKKTMAKGPISLKVFIFAAGITPYNN